ncbi:MAG: hypothetical protein V4644_01205 [Patescibacteria group bacterium]
MRGCLDSVPARLKTLKRQFTKGGMPIADVFLVQGEQKKKRRERRRLLNSRPLAAPGATDDWMDRRDMGIGGI